MQSSLTRRRLLKGTAAAASVGAVGAASPISPVGEADAIAPLLAYGAVAAASGIAGVGLGAGATMVLDDSPTEEEVADMSDYQHHQSLYSQSKSARVKDENVLPSMLILMDIST